MRDVTAFADMLSRPEPRRRITWTRLSDLSAILENSAEGVDPDRLIDLTDREKIAYFEAQRFTNEMMKAMEAESEVEGENRVIHFYFTLLRESWGYGVPAFKVFKTASQLGELKLEAMRFMSHSEEWLKENPKRVITPAQRASVSFRLNEYPREPDYGDDELV